MMKIQDFLAKDEDYNSDQDSLNGWDYFANDAKEEQDKLKNKKSSLNFLFLMIPKRIKKKKRKQIIS